MTSYNDPSIGHSRYRELASLAALGSLDAVDMHELRDHFAICEECADVFAQYQSVIREAIPMLAQGREHQPAHFLWNDRQARRKLLSAVQRRELAQSSARGLKWALGLAASIAIVIAAASWHTRRVNHELRQLAFVRQALDNARSVAEREQNTIRADSASIADLDAKLAMAQTKIVKLRLNEQLSTNQLSKTLKSANAEAEAWRQVALSHEQQLQNAIAERDETEAQVRAAEQELRDLRSSLAGLQVEQQKSLEATGAQSPSIAQLKAMNDDLSRKLASAEEFLSADRDIRDLIGARNLYIADVFDVDSASRTRHAFGRVFYTRGKSLVFYAFDLDRQHGSTNASFQVWGEKEVARGQHSAALNLGLLYLDSEAKRRWALRFDDPQMLTDIDAIFVTVEPQGGSPRPTGKPFLFAMLRKEANHP